MTAGGAASDTAPPRHEDAALARLKKKVSGKASDWLLPLLQRAGREYVGGETLDDAVIVARHLAAQGFPCTLGFWDTPAYAPGQVAEIYSQTIEQAAGFEDSYVSIKPPALRFDADVAAALARAAETRELRLHCDSHGPEVADQAQQMIDGMLKRVPGCQVGTTLPGRWQRSLADADRAVAQGLAVRVVKGQWPDPADPGRDLRSGFLEVIERLAGRARLVAVASHDAAVVEQAVARLRAAGTPFELELIHGVPKARILDWAAAERIPVRIYVPFGKGFIPNAIRVLRRNPRLAWRMLGGLFAPRRSAKAASGRA